MSNPRYVKGRKKEYRICDELRDEGFEIVQRTAGSHSPIDIIAVKKDKGLILLIQSKPDNYKGKEYEEWMWLNGNFEVKFEIR